MEHIVQFFIGSAFVSVQLFNPNNLTLKKKEKLRENISKPDQ